MKRRDIFSLPTMLIIVFASTPCLYADGGFFAVGESADLAQTRQEVTIAFHRNADNTADQVTYVLRSLYSGTPTDLAWVIPMPVTPTNIVAHQDDSLFESLGQLTRPEFLIIWPGGGVGCFCAGLAGRDSSQSGLVTVEASGQAGIFDYDIVTSTESTALATWLNDNGYTMPTGAQNILDRYIQQDMHFLAIRVNQPSQVPQDTSGGIEIPPIQFTCQMSQRFYPIAISEISAANETEIIIYVLAQHRVEASNVQNGTIDDTALIYDPSSNSLTNYETLFTQKITELGGTGLVTEYAYQMYTGYLGTTLWPDAPSEALNLPFLTRMRTVLTKANMAGLDYQFQDAATDDTILNYFSVSASTTATASIVGEPLAGMIFFGLCCSIIKRRKNSKY